MGQEIGENIQDPREFMNKLNNLQMEKKEKKENYELKYKGFDIAINIGQEYFAYKDIIELNKKSDNAKKASNELKVLKKWMKMVKIHDNKKKSFFKKKVVEPHNDDDINCDNFTNNMVILRLYEYFFKYTKKFKKKLFKGPTESFRWLSWSIINQMALVSSDKVYKHYLAKDLDKENEEQIKKDNERTITYQGKGKYYQDKLKDGVSNVIKAFWSLDRISGYCQGMNIVIGFMLILLDGNEVEAFYMLISLLSDTNIKRKEGEYSLRGLYCQEFPLLKLLVYIFDCKFKETYPQLKAKIDETGITYGSWILSWFQTLFTIILPINMCKRVWDCIFAEDIFFMVKFGLAFISFIKDDIMKINEEPKIVDYFNNLKKSSMNIFDEINGKKFKIEEIIAKASKMKKIDPQSYIQSYKNTVEEKKYNEFLKLLEKTKNIVYKYEVDDKKEDEKKLNERKTLWLQQAETVEENENDDDEKEEEEDIKEDDKDEPNEEKNEIIINENEINTSSNLNKINNNEG
jgi:hypothetical protein